MPLQQTVSTGQQNRALGLSTFAFTICFAVWTIFSIIGIQIKKDLGEVTAASQFNTMNLVAAESTANLKKKILTIAAALALGLFLGLVLVVIREWMDPSIRYEADVERLLGVPVLVSLPESQQLRFQATKVASMAISSKTEGK